MSPIIILISILFAGILAIIGAAVVTWVRDENRKGRTRALAQLSRAQAVIRNNERVLRAIANDTAGNPQLEASNALYDIELSLYNESEN